MGTKHSQRSEPLDTVVSHASHAVAFQIREKEKKVKKKTEERHGQLAMMGFPGEKDGFLFLRSKYGHFGRRDTACREIQ